MTATRRNRPPLAYRDIDDVARALREAGGRFSAARRRVLEALFAADAPLPADAVAPRRWTARSVYRALEYLEELGVVRHVHLGHGPGLYALTGGGEREYLVCERCDRVTALEADAARRRARRDRARVRLPRPLLPLPDRRALRGLRGRDRRLTVGDPAVAGRQPLGHEHAQAGGAQPRRRRPRAAAGSGTRRRTAPRCRARARRPPRRTPRRSPPRPCRGSARRRRPAPTPARRSAATASTSGRASSTTRPSATRQLVAAVVARARRRPRARSRPGPRR